MKILMIGPFSPPITGNSLANDTLFKGFKNKNIQADKINFAFPTLKENLGKITLSKLAHYILVYRYLFKIFYSDKIYMTIGQTFFGVVKYAPFIYVSKALKKEMIVHVHGNYLKKEYNNLRGIKKYIFQKIIAHFEKGIVLSDKLKPNLTLFIKSKNIFSVYNFVEKNILEKIKPKDINQKNTKELNIVFLSNLMEEKGIIDLLKALNILKERGVNFKAKIAGAMDYSFENKIVYFFEKLKNNVEYLGVVTGNDKLNLLLNSNIFILPTYYSMEGQPISILEAMATGNIILTTNHAGISDIFKDKKNGFYIEKQNPEDIANKLEHISKNWETLTSIMKDNYIEASKKYTTDKFINKIINIITK